ncbi:MAG: hypothetical protein KDN22_07355 [Verrucomicrobiae bacterium]|nr:hypothetical protein [Verrucomicrobiae bacterium]
MNLGKKLKRARFCYSFVARSVAVGATIGLGAKLLGVEEDALMNTSWGPTLSVVFGLAFLTCFFGMIKYLYDLDPGVHLRGKSKEELEDIVADDRMEIWHPKAIEMIQEMKSRTRQ